MRIPYEGYNHFRYVDYHQHNDWAIGFASLSSFNECFVWSELNISPRLNTTKEITYKIAEESGHYRFLFDVIDPLAMGQKSDTKKEDGTVRTTVDDINKYLEEFKSQGLCEGGYFQPGNTKGTRGREEIRHRLRNSEIARTPFNNEAENYKNNPDVINIKREKYLPTIWWFANCRQARLSFKHWREEKGKPTQAYSHHCTGMEMLLKDARFRMPVSTADRPQERKKVRYFQVKR